MPRAGPKTANRRRAVGERGCRSRSPASSIFFQLGLAPTDAPRPLGGSWPCSGTWRAEIRMPRGRGRPRPISPAGRRGVGGDRAGADASAVGFAGLVAGSSRHGAPNGAGWHTYPSPDFALPSRSPSADVQNRARGKAGEIIVAVRLPNGCAAPSSRADRRRHLPVSRQQLHRPMWPSPATSAGLLPGAPQLSSRSGGVGSLTVSGCPVMSNSRRCRAVSLAPSGTLVNPRSPQRAVTARTSQATRVVANQLQPDCPLPFPVAPRWCRP